MHTRGLWRFLVVMGLTLPAVVAFAQVPDLAEVLKETGLKYTELEGAADSWRVPFDGRDGKTIDVYLTYNDDKKQFALIFATVVDRDDNYAYNREVLVEALKLSNDYPGVKFVLDEDRGDIDCQTEVYMATITAESLAMYINLVASMSDDNAAKLNQLAGAAPDGVGAAPAGETLTSAAAAADRIEWLTSYEEALAAAAEHNKPVIVDYFGVNCGACERMMSVTYVDPQVVARRDDFIFVKVDVEMRQDLMNKYSIVILPTTVLLTPQGQEVRREEGYLDPPGMLKLMGDA